jgi:hypothetical protein
MSKPRLDTALYWICWPVLLALIAYLLWRKTH